MSGEPSVCFPGSWSQRSETLHVTMWRSLVLHVNQAVSYCYQAPRTCSEAEAKDEEQKGRQPKAAQRASHREMLWPPLNHPPPALLLLTVLAPFSLPHCCSGKSSCVWG